MRWGHPDIVQCLIDQDVLSDKDTLLLAASCGHDAVVAQLIHMGTMVHVGNDGETALHRAASSGSIGTVQTLVNAGFDLNVRDARGENALFWAITEGHLEIVSFLVSSGAELTSNLIGRSPLLVAIDNNQTEVAEFLLKTGINPRKKARNGDRALNVAVSHGLHRVTELLLENKVPQERNSTGSTPLYCAVDLSQDKRFN